MTNNSENNTPAVDAVASGRPETIFELFWGYANHSLAGHFNIDWATAGPIDEDKGFQPNAGLRRGTNGTIALSKCRSAARRNVEWQNCPNRNLEIPGYGTANGAQARYRW